MSVPNDIAIVGFDDIPMAAWNSYKLTTIRQPVERMVLEAISLIEGADKPGLEEGIVRILPGRLIVRASA